MNANPSSNKRSSPSKYRVLLSRCWLFVWLFLSICALGSSVGPTGRDAPKAANGKSPAFSASQLTQRATSGRFRTKNIEEVVVGECILARDEHTGQLARKRVLHALKREVDHLRILTIRSDQAWQDQKLQTTNEHPFWVVGQGWIPAGEVSVGQKVIHENGEFATVVDTKLVPHPEGIEVFNLEVDGFHTYLVSATKVTRGVLVHNKPNGSEKPPPNPNGRKGTKAHQEDVEANNNQSTGRFEPKKVGGTVPDGVGKPGQSGTIRDVPINPGKGRIITESENFNQNGQPVSLGRAQVRATRAADPDATIVMTDPFNSTRPPLIFKPGEQPAPPGYLPKGFPLIVPFP